MNKAGDEARVYEAFMAPNAEHAASLKLARGPWLVTLHKGAERRLAGDRDRRSEARQASIRAI